MKKVTLAKVMGVIRAAQAELLELQTAELRNGGITATSYAEITVQRLGDRLLVQTDNRGGFGHDEPEADPILLGHTAEGIAVYYRNLAPGIVSGRDTLRHNGFFHLFQGA